MLTLCAGILTQRLSSGLLDMLAVGHSARFPLVTVNIFFVSEQNDANIIG